MIHLNKERGRGVDREWVQFRQELKRSIGSTRFHFVSFPSKLEPPTCIYRFPLLSFLLCIRDQKTVHFLGSQQLSNFSSLSDLIPFSAHSRIMFEEIVNILINYFIHRSTTYFDGSCELNERQV